jgi:hypothetical protein
VSSKTRDAWMRQLRLLTVAMEEFQDSPTPEREQGLKDQMIAYAYAVNSGQVEKPTVWRSS